jgi:hypothetical protein
MMRASVAGAEHYREIADKLREAASSCQFAGARREILHLAGAIDHSSALGVIRGRMARRKMTLLRWIVFGALIYSILPSVASAREHRSRTVTREFQREHPCPSTGRTAGACPGFRKDHIVPLACGGPDTVQNLQWQTIRDARGKDQWERKACAR